MKPDAEQIEFIRQHGVTRCPPAPEFRVYWGGRSIRHGPPEASEGDLLVTGLAVFDYRWPKPKREGRRMKDEG